MSGSPATAEHAFVLGLDGVPWDLIERFTAEGELPNFGRLREEGASGPLESTRPPTTPLAWPSIATGVRPDKHGIYGFQKLSSSYTHRMYTSRDRRQPALWELLSPVAVSNVPMTYPPEAVDGALVSGMMTPSTDEAYTHPPELRERIAERIPGYEIGLDYPDYADRLEEFPVDIAPTLLHGLGRPVPANADGDVLEGVFVDGSPPTTRGVECVAVECREGTDGAEGDFSDVEDRLKGLGYME